MNDYEVEEMKAFHLGLTLSEYRSRDRELMGQVDQVKAVDLLMGQVAEAKAMEAAG